MDPIPALEAPMKDGIKCHQCLYIAWQERVINKHYRQVHGWANDRGRGRPTKQQQKQQRHVPWTSGVYYQHFFKGQYASGWFEVKAAIEVQHVKEAEETKEQ